MCQHAQPIDTKPYESIATKQPRRTGGRRRQVVLGLVGGSLVVAQSGFATSPRLGGPSTFVPAPEAYLLAGIMYCMSAIGMLALLRARPVSGLSIAVAAVLYVSVAVFLVWVLRPN